MSSFFSRCSTVQFQFVVARTQLGPTLCDPMDCSTQASLTFTISQSLFQFMSIESVMPSSNLNLCSHLLLLPSIFPSIRVFSNRLALRIMWPEYQNLSFSISSSNEYSGSVSFRIDWFGLCAVQGTLESLLQHHSLKESILWSQPSLSFKSHIHT